MVKNGKKISWRKRHYAFKWRRFKRWIVELWPTIKENWVEILLHLAICLVSVFIGFMVGIVIALLMVLRGF